MRTIPIEHIHQAIAVLGSDGIAESEIEARVADFASDEISARRLIDWIPEAFAAILIPHVGNVNLPKTFTAKAKYGKWLEFEFTREPVFVNSLSIAMGMYHSDSRNAFANIVKRSAMVDAVNKALNAGDSIDGASLSGPALIGIPAEVYQMTPIPFWQRWRSGSQ
jgi:hypothetical protein